VLQRSEVPFLEKPQFRKSQLSGKKKNISLIQYQTTIYWQHAILHSPLWEKN